MRILITSGGTKVKVDRVRHLGNMSNGTFGSRIALQLLRNAPPLSHPQALCRLTFLHANHSKTPFCLPMDVTSDSYEEQLLAVTNLRKEYQDYSMIYNEPVFKDFEEYTKLLRTFTRASQTSAGFNIVVLAAAVSDYLVANYVDGKIRSKDALNIELTPAPKLISEIHKRLPKCDLIGFKLLVDSTDQELIAAAQESAVKNNCALVVANDLRDIVQGKHRVLLVTKRGAVYTASSKPSDPPHKLADIVAKAILLPYYKPAIDDFAEELDWVVEHGFNWEMNRRVK
jgi:phosphopantothenate-cysteine ligase